MTAETNYLDYLTIILIQSECILKLINNVKLCKQVLMYRLCLTSLCYMTIDQLVVSIVITPLFRNLLQYK